MGPEVRAQPRAACWPEPPQWAVNGRSGAPEVCVVVADPTASAVLHLCRVASTVDEFRHHAQQGLMTLLQIRWLRWPVVHLCVDVDRVLAFPRRRHGLVPQSLQVRWLGVRTRTRDEKISTVLEIQCG